MSALEYYQATLNFLKDNKVLLLLVTVLLGGNIYQATNGVKETTEDKEIKCDCNLKQHVKEFH